MFADTFRAVINARPQPFSSQNKYSCSNCASFLLNMVTLNAESLEQRTRRVPIGWWRIAALRWVFSRVTSGRLFLRTKRAQSRDARNVSLRSEAPLSPPRLASILWSVIGALGSPASSRWGVRPFQSTKSLCAELHYCWEPSLKTERDAAELKLHEQRATSYLAAGSIRVDHTEREITGAWNHIQPVLAHIQSSLMKRKKLHRTSK